MIEINHLNLSFYNNINTNTDMSIANSIFNYFFTSGYEAIYQIIIEPYYKLIRYDTANMNITIHSAANNN